MPVNRGVANKNTMYSIAGINSGMHNNPNPGHPTHANDDKLDTAPIIVKNIGNICSKAKIMKNNNPPRLKANDDFQLDSPVNLGNKLSIPASKNCLM